MSKHLVYVGIGSNIEAEKYIRLAIKYLHHSFGPHCDLQLSPVYKTQAIGFDGNDFFNLVASFMTELSALEVALKLKEIEQQNGRCHNQEKFSARTLDIDLLLYDQAIINDGNISIPRDEIEKYAFVLSPLADLAPDLIHPVSGQNMAQMWLQLKNKAHAGSLQRITFNW